MNSLPSPRRRILQLAALMASTSVIGWTPAAVAAAPGSRIVVNSLADVVANDGSCTLREAIAAANSDRASGTLAGECAAGSGSDQIDLAGLTGRIVLQGRALVISGPVSILGPGAKQLVVSGNTLSRVIDISAAASPVRLAGFTISNGRTKNADDAGAGVRARSDLVLESMVVSDNLTSGSRAHGGGIAAYRGLQLIETSVTGNATSGSSAHGAGIAVLGAVTAPITATLERSLVAMNSTSAKSAYGGALYAIGGAVSVVNSTLSTNSAARAGAVELSGARLSLLHATLADNIGTKGVEAISASAESAVQADNTVIAQWSASGKACNQVFSAGGHNIVANSKGTDTSCGGTVLSLGALRLDGLKDNGGPTQTHALLTRSFAIDAAGGDCRLPVDQRGQSRGAACDLGAYEFNRSTAENAVPEPFSFGERTVGQPGQAVISSWVVLLGLTRSTTVSVRGGEWQQAGGAWTSEAATVPVNASIRVRTYSPAIGGRAVATVCAGPTGVEVCAAFTVKTQPSAAATQLGSLTEEVTQLRGQLAQAKQEAVLQQQIVTDLRQKLSDSDTQYKAVANDNQLLKDKVDALVKDGATKDIVIAALEARIAELEAAPAP